MTKNRPYLAMDSAGKQTILCDYPVKMFDNTTKEKKAKMAHVMTNQEVQSHTKKLVARLLGQDAAAAMDDETIAMIKEFLSDKLSDKDHTKVCSMLDGDVEAQDTEPAPPFRRMPDGRIVEPRTAEDSKADFHRRYPGLAAIRIDNSGIQPRARGGSYSDAASSKSFAERYPGLAHIRQR